MSISYSNNHGVQVTIHGVSNQVPTNTDYRYVIPNNFVLYDPNTMFDRVKDEYYAAALSEIGRYISGVDFKHYDDPRCRCILCWTHRTNVSFSDGAVNIPTVKAKLNFVLDQLRTEKFRFDSRTSRRRVYSMLYMNFPGISEYMVTKLWNTLFQETQDDSPEPINIRLELDQIVAGVDIISLRDSDIKGKEYPTDILNSIKELQSRIDKDYNTERNNNEICDMTKNELVSKHVYMLKETLYYMRKKIKKEKKELNNLWKAMFVHDFIIDILFSDRLINKISERRVKNTDYAPYRGVNTTTQKANILSVKLIEFESAIDAEKDKDYFTDPLVRRKISDAYESFNNEFYMFLRVPEKKDVKKLQKSEKIKTRFSLSFKTTRKRYELTYLEQEIKNLKDESWNQAWNDIAREKLKLVQIERDIHRFGVKSTGIQRINCKKELRGYIENAWNRMRTGQVVYTKGGKAYTPEDFKKREDALYAEKLEEYAKEYADAKVFAYYLELSPDKRELVDRKWINYQYFVATEFYKKNGVKTDFNEEKIREFWENDTRYNDSPPDKQRWLDSKYSGDGGYKEQEKLNFMKWEINETHKLSDLWAAVFWVEVQKKEKRSLWQFAWEVYSWMIPAEMAKKGEISEQYSAFVNEAKEIKEQRIRLKYEAKAEMYLTFDIFGGGEVDDNILDMFLLKNLPPSERKGFFEIRRLKRLTQPDLVVQERIKYIRSICKKRVFDREIRKRALILPLKKMNEFLKYEWTDAFDKGEIDEKDMTDWQRSLRLSMDQYDQRNEVAPFPYDKDWISHKYLNIRKWLTKDTKVYVLCKYKDLVSEERTDRSLVTFKLGEPGPDAVMVGDAGYWVEVPFNPDPTLTANIRDLMQKQHREDIDRMPEQWESDGNTEDLKMAWVEEIHPDSVTVRFERKFTIEKRYMLPNKIETARINLKNVFDNILDYNVVRERTDEEQQKEEENRKKAKLLADKDRERRLLIRNIVNQELIKEQEEQEMIKKDAEDALRMYDESRKDERYQFFIEQKNNIIQPYLDSGDKTVGFREAMSEAIRLGNEFKMEENFVKIEMFQRGRQQWLDEVIGEKKPWREGFNDPTMRSKIEDIEFRLTTKVMDRGRHVGVRANSNRTTYEYRRMMYVYGKNSDESIRMFLLNKLEPANNNKQVLSPDQKRKIMKKYKKDMEEAIKRDIQIHKNRNKRKYSIMIKERRDRIMRAIQDVIDSIDQQDEDGRLLGQDSNIREYILSGRLDQDVNFRLKTPKLMYTDEMWKSELETSLEPLDNPTFGELLDYVTKTKLIKYLQKDSKRNILSEDETEYQRDFKTKNSQLMPVYPTPSNRTLRDMADNFKPPVVNDVVVKSNVATNVRIGMGPGAWFEINKRSELMRQTDMSMEDRLLFAEDVESFREEENSVRLSNKKNTATRARMASMLVDKTYHGSSEWIESDSDGSIRVLDDLIGEFTYDEVTLQSVRISGQNDIPTHVRLNTIYFDTVRGTENRVNVRRLVPFYVVSLYRKEGTSYKRLKVRNRADKTFLPRQNKHEFITKNKKIKDKFKRIYTLEDYRGYACSVCLNEEEFQSLVNPTQLTATDRRIVQIPGPFLYKYHKIRFERERKKIELLLIERKRNGTVIRDEIISMGDPDDLSAPFSDGMIRLGGNIESMETQSNIIKISGFCLDEDGNKAPDPNSGISDNREIHSNDMYAIFEESIGFFGGNVVIYKFRNDKWDYLNVKKLRSVEPILKWSEDILFVASHSIVEGFDTNNKCIRTLLLRGHSNIIKCMSVKGNRIVTGSEDKTLIVWNNKNHPIERKSRVLVESGRNKLSYRFGNVVRVEEQSCEVDLLKIPGYPTTRGVFTCIPTSHMFSLYGHSGEVTSVAWGDYIVSSSEDKNVIVWNNDQVKYRLDFTILRLSDPVVPKWSYLTKYAPYIALINPRILFYGIGNILGKANIETGKRVPFDNAVVNIVSELPIRTSDIPMPKMPSRVYFKDDGEIAIRTDEEMQILREKRNETMERTQMSMQDKYTEEKAYSDSSDGWSSDESSEDQTPANEMNNRRDVLDILDFLYNNRQNSYESGESSGWDTDSDDY